MIVILYGVGEFEGYLVLTQKFVLRYDINLRVPSEVLIGNKILMDHSLELLK